MDLPIPVLDKLPKGLSFPTWVVLDVQGPYPARAPRNALQALVQRTDSLESLDRKIDALAGAPGLHGVLIRLGELPIEAGTAWHLMRSLRRLSKEKRTIAYASSLNMVSLLVASGAREIALPESADLSLTGFAMEVTFLGEFLRKHGIAFENARIKEYKSALTRFSESRMDAFDREQREALLASAEATWVREVAGARSVDENTVREWLTEGVTSARRARELGIIDRVAYEDELVGPGTRPFSTVVRALLKPDLSELLPSAPGASRIAVVTLQGAIVPGRSRNNPLPIPLFGGPQAGSDTVVTALRRAQKDPGTKAIVFYVNSGGGSALASDLIWREVQRSRKPVVAVMGDVAASGGYYVLTHAQRVIAAPTTITGSIGVVAGKPVLQEFNERQGFRPERVSRSEYPGLMSASTPWSERERALIDRSIEEVYDRFTGRVAEGRGLTQARVNELGRGRVWSGADALEVGLIDELGDLNIGIERACELAGLGYDTPVWNAEARGKWELPDLARPAADLGEVLKAPDFLQERALLWLDADWRLRSR
ncbi:S49 family peptidase [Deinococcus peraridilitoris]|uniref:ClpP class periplasmic serine protease n=1 Tax=Deinococcus peraridilitoris (strain DSM 19664 / LMG 22246 / CIP 109416 / KR-200) TaxID=937777 RepID=K9ZXV3_DEIPD|nr:S49 family peptidase [Deinococcus peraridilitoris]AFZ65742.1 ClpP class periplasmic serine protease [Deinococcus peraridilitoris DSM 19664]